MQLRIGYLIGTRGFGGLELNQIKNAIELQARGHEVFLFCIYNSPSHQYILNTNLPVVLIQSHKHHYDFQAAFRLYQKIKKLKIEHLVLRAVFDMSIAATVKFLSSNTLKVHYFMEMQMTANKKAWFRTFRYSFFDSWVCPLDYMAEQVIKNTRFSPERVYVIPSGVENRFFEFQIDPSALRNKHHIPMDKKILGIVGRIDPKKNQKLVLEALVELKDTSFFVVIVGQVTPDQNGSTYLSEIKEYIQKHQLEEQVLFVPHTEEIPRYFNMFDFTIMASDNESVGMVTLESLATETPVIGSNCGGTKEILKKGGGILFETGNPKDLAEKIRHAFGSYEHQDNLKELVAAHKYSTVAIQLESHLSQF